MKKVILIIVVLLWWQSGYSQEVCNIRKKKNISIARANTTPLSWMNPWSEYVDKQNHGNACLKVLVPKDIKIKVRHIQQIYDAYAASMKGHISHIGMHPRVVDKNRIGIYTIYIDNNSLGSKRGCALYSGKQIILPFVPEIKGSYQKKVQEDIYQARLEVVKAFLKKHNNYTEEQKEEIVKIFTNGFYHFPLRGR